MGDGGVYRQKNRRGGDRNEGRSAIDGLLFPFPREELGHKTTMAPLPKADWRGSWRGKSRTVVLVVPIDQSVTCNYQARSVTKITPRDGFNRKQKSLHYMIRACATS